MTVTQDGLFTATDSLVAEQLEILDGEALLVAGQTVVLGNGFQVGPRASLRVEIDAAAECRRSREGSAASREATGSE